MLASRGIASLALAIFAYEDLPKNTDELDLGYFEEAVEVLLSRPEVVPDRCGAVAVSKSGDIVFSMATLFEPVKAVVGINSCTMVLHSRFTYKGNLYKQGQQSPLQALVANEAGAYSIDMGSLFDNNNPTMIPVEEADDDTHFLVVAGEDDPWGFKSSLAPFRERMLQHGRRNLETVLYPGAGHIIEPPYGPLVQYSYQPHVPGRKGGIIMNWGGEPKATCEAQVDLWRRMQTFFLFHVRDESPWYQSHLTQHPPPTHHLSQS